MKQIVVSLQRGFTDDGPTRASAVYRLLIVAVVFYYVTDAAHFHPGYVEHPPGRLAVTLLMLLSSWTAWLGYRTRLSAAVLAACWALAYATWGLSDRPSYRLVDAYMLQALVVLALLPSGRSLSIDRWLAVRRARRAGSAVPEESGPLWAAGLMVVSLSCIHVWYLVDLVEHDWSSGFEMERLWVSNWGSSDSLATSGALVHFAAQFASWAVLLASAVVAVGLWIPRFRIVAISTGVLLQLALWPFLGTWPLTVMILATYAAVLPPQLVHDQLGSMFESDAA